MIAEKQRDILFEACKEVATNSKCPKWIEDILKTAVIKARNLKTEVQTIAKPIEIGDICISSKKDDPCEYKILKEHDSINGVRLFTVQIMKGNINNPEGLIVPNVPETLLLVKG